MWVFKHFFWGAAAIATAVGMGVPSAGHAALVTESFTDTFSVPPGTGTYTQDLSFQQFDSNLGLLTGVIVNLAGSGYAILSLYNFNSFGVAYTNTSTSGDIVVNAAGFAGQLALTGLLANVTTGTLSGTAAPGATSIQSAIQTYDTSGAISADQFATYTGAGTATVTLSVGPFQANVTYGRPTHPSGTTFAGGDGNVDGGVTVTYTYDDTYAVPVPEPSTLAVFGTGIFLLGFMRRHKAAASGRDGLLPPDAAA
jgi:PEP-CTERM motif-containing protein